MDMPLEDSYKYTSKQQCRLKADNEQQEAILRKGQAKITWAEVGRVAVGESSPSFVTPLQAAVTGDSFMDKHTDSLDMLEISTNKSENENLPISFS